MPGTVPQLPHIPVLLADVVRLFAETGGEYFVDATVGAGGHSSDLLERFPGLTVLAIDQDQSALEQAAGRLLEFDRRVEFVHANFDEIESIVRHWGHPPDAILADLGVSSMHLDEEDRGFSFRGEAALDMRMDTSRGQTAGDLLAGISEIDLANLIYGFGEERFSRRIARNIVRSREDGRPVTTTLELANLVRRAVPRKRGDKIDPATRTFQALRIAVNRELEVLEKFLDHSIDLLKTGGILMVITFHSLEDRIVKNRFQRFAGKCMCPPRIPQCICGAEKRVEIVTRKPIVADEDEVNANPRSRSAKLRACRRL